MKCFVKTPVSVSQNLMTVSPYNAEDRTSQEKFSKKLNERESGNRPWILESSELHIPS